jgi:hypothetical protein
MTARVLEIDDKCKRFPSAVVRPSDFAFHDVGALDSSHVVNDPTLSLYCLDVSKRAALFVRTPPDVNLAQAPFVYQVQYEKATELVSVSFGELHELAAAVSPSEHLVLVRNTGRCGSTLVSLALAAADNAVSLSQPDVCYQSTSSATKTTQSSAHCSKAAQHSCAPQGRLPPGRSSSAA